MFYPTTFQTSDPFSLMRSMMRDADRVPSRGAAQVEGFPAVNIWQGDDAIAVTAELPGVDPADIDISVQENVLRISGVRKPPELPDDARWHRNERGFGRFSRAVRVPFHAADDKVEAWMVNGVLRIVVGRRDEDKPRKIEIKAA